MTAVAMLASEVGLVQACAGLGVARSDYYRRLAGPETKVAEPAARRRVPRALSEAERTQARELLDSERFVDASPRAVHATLLDEEVYVCHWRTMYRILAEHGQVRERRDQLRHPAYAKPELLATRPRELWSWDITKLRGPVKWTYYYMYVILDVFSRYVVGWMVAEYESAALAGQLIDETCAKEGIQPGDLILHADHGAAMVALSVAQLLANLGVEPSHSRPHVSDDNPYSEAQFKTMKYRPGFPDRFSDLAHSLSFGREFFGWYNNEHRHSGLAYLTPAMVHFGQTEQVLSGRRAVMAEVYAAHPERFVRGRPVVAELPKEVWINKPTDNATEPPLRPAAPVEEPGAEPGSRAGPNPYSGPAERTLEAGEHRASIALPPARMGRALATLQ
jgi:putative transposase